MGKLNIKDEAVSEAKAVLDDALEDGEFAIETNELSVNANGGTEMMQRALAARLDPELLNKYQIIPTRVRELDPDKKSILWIHDMFNDPEVQHLADGGWEKFDKLVYVSHWQKSTFEMGLNIPPSAGIVMQNAIEPFNDVAKDKEGPIRLIYHTTPHRGLELVYPVFDALAKEYGDKIHLDVFSSFEAYGWPQRDEPFQELFQQMKDHEHITYHGYQPNDVVRKYLERAHIFTYPSIWTETSCIAAIEALAAGCLTVTSSLGALPETCANFAWMTSFDESANRHANMHYGLLKAAIDGYWNEDVQTNLYNQRAYFNLWYNWQFRERQWEGLLNGLLSKQS